MVRVLRRAIVVVLGVVALAAIAAGTAVGVTVVLQQHRPSDQPPAVEEPQEVLYYVSTQRKKGARP
jgi:hypothetical protein